VAIARSSSGSFSGLTCAPVRLSACRGRRTTKGQHWHLIDEKIKSGVDQETYDLAKISRQAAIINLLASTLILLASMVLVFVILS